MTTLLLSFLLLLPALLAFSGVVTAAQRCADCGSTPVPYPLSTGPDCGDQDYKIRCASSTLWFDALNGSSYTISNIVPENQRLVIRPASFANRNTCVTTDLQSLGLQLNSSLPFNITSSNTVMYLNCSDSMLRSPLDCSSTSLCHSYVNITEEGSAACKSAPICCTFRAGGSTTSYRIRLQEKGCRADRTFVNLNPSSPVSRWPATGVELEWVVPREHVCQSCL